MNPGTWQQYVQRPDNRGISIALLERKYIQELYQYQSYLTEVFDPTATTSAAASAGGGGGELSEDTPIPPPIIDTLPLITNLPVFLDGTAQTNNGIWNNSPTSFTYQWTRENINIIGATSNSYILTEDDIGSQIRCVITATNEGGSTSATTSNNVYIE